MVTIIGRQPSPNVIDRRTNRSRGALAAAAGFFGLLGSAAASVGFAGIDATLCLFGLGDCEFSVSQMERVENEPGGAGVDDCVSGSNMPPSLERNSGGVSASSAPPVDPCAKKMSEEQKERLKRIVSITLGDAERIWSADFRARGEIWRPAKLVLFDQPTQSDCGLIPAGAGPIYCRFDETIYLDFAFFDKAQSRYGATGGVLPAFIIAHEVGHHVQTLRGDFDRYLAAVELMQLLGEDDSISEDERSEFDTAQQLEVRLELQADCLAGFAAGKAQTQFDLLDPQDIDEALADAVALGDDNIQLVESGFINDAAFTHGSGEQRKRWLTIGFFAEEIQACDTWTQPFSEL